jgi:transcriptional regulator with XRE-family HTH domain
MSATRSHAGDPEGALPVFPGFREMAESRRRLLAELVDQRQSLGLSQTEVAARMGTSQSAVARLEAVAGDVRLSTLERYADAVGRTLRWSLEPASGREGNPSGGGAEVRRR